MELIIVVSEIGDPKNCEHSKANASPKSAA
jgi:hypothetical protein